MRWGQKDWEGQQPTWTAFAPAFQQLTGVVLDGMTCMTLNHCDPGLWPPAFFAGLKQSLADHWNKWSFGAIQGAFHEIAREDADFLHPESVSRLQAGFEF